MTVKDRYYNYTYSMTMTAAALFFVTHGSSDRRSWLSLQNLVSLAQSRSDRLIGGGCLEGQEITLAQQLEQFAIKAIAIGITEIEILPMLLLAGVHVSEDIPNEVAIAQSNLQSKLQEDLIFRITPHLGTDSQIPNLLLQHFQKYKNQKYRNTENIEKQGQILVSHGSRRVDANQVVEDLATHCQAIAAYWGVEPKIETQIENLLAQGINQINVLPYFLTEGGITEAIARKLDLYRDRAQIQLLPVPLSDQKIVDIAISKQL
jgi:sirohydrochlorin cobaltochelatase